MVALALAACGDGTGGAAVDGAVVDGAAVDGAAGVDAGVPIPAVLFLNFDGAAVVKGVDDPTQNRSILIVPQGATVPPWRDGTPGRAASVAAVAAGVRSVLAPYAVEVVTTRPAAGPYDMILFGGHAAMLFGAGPIEAFGGDMCTWDPDISYVTEAVTDDAVAASLAVTMFGHGHFIPYTARTGDCLCYRDTACRNPAGVLCTIGGADTPVFDGGGGCSEQPLYPERIDVHAWFTMRFGARP